MNIEEWEEYKDFINYFYKKKISNSNKLNQIVSYMFNNEGKKLDH